MSDRAAALSTGLAARTDAGPTAVATGEASDHARSSTRTRIALRIAYDGRSFPGWQTQSSGAAIQDRLEAALSTIAGHPVSTICAGRTDAGVHALSQVVHFDTCAMRPDQAWIRGVNALLPVEIAVQSLARVEPGFHARHGARRRAYTYLLHRAPHRHPLLHARAGWVFQPMALEAMIEAAANLVGEHDFSAFRAAQCQARSPVRRLESIQITESGALVRIELQANAFLHHMVRNIVGALVWVGIGRRPPQWLAELLAGRDRTRAAPTFAPQGLYLTGIDYGADTGLACWPPHDPPLAGL